MTKKTNPDIYRDQILFLFHSLGIRKMKILPLSIANHSSIARWCVMMYAHYTTSMSIIRAFLQI